MSHAGHQNKEVLIKEIAERLTVGEWFTKETFSNTTGVALKSCSVRLKMLLDEGMLERRGSRLCFEWRMTTKKKRLMLEKGIKNKCNRGKLTNKIKLAGILDAEILAHHEHGHRKLKSVWMV